jgi:hypothetical protein
MERTMLMLLKATEARLQAALSGASVQHIDQYGDRVISAKYIEDIRADLYLAILELTDKVK